MFAYCDKISVEQIRRNEYKCTKRETCVLFHHVFYLDSFKKKYFFNLLIFRHWTNDTFFPAARNGRLYFKHNLYFLKCRMLFLELQQSNSIKIDLVQSNGLKRMFVAYEPEVWYEPLDLFNLSACWNFDFSFGLVRVCGFGVIFFMLQTFRNMITR